MGTTLWLIKSTPSGCFPPTFCYILNTTFVDTPKIHTLWWRLGEKLLLFARAVWSLWGFQPSTRGRQAWCSTQNFAMLAFNIVFFFNMCADFVVFFVWAYLTILIGKAKQRKHEDVTVVSVLHWTFFSHGSMGFQKNHSTWNMWRCTLWQTVT